MLFDRAENRAKHAGINEQRQRGTPDLEIPTVLGKEIIGIRATFTAATLVISLIRHQLFRKHWCCRCLVGRQTPGRNRRHRPLLVPTHFGAQAFWYGAKALGNRPPATESSLKDNTSELSSVRRGITKPKTMAPAPKHIDNSSDPWGASSTIFPHLPDEQRCRLERALTLPRDADSFPKGSR
jgi:hypothetical protein